MGMWLLSSPKAGRLGADSTGPGRSCSSHRAGDSFPAWAVRQACLQGSVSWAGERQSFCLLTGPGQYLAIPHLCRGWGERAPLPEARKPQRFEGYDLCTQRRHGEKCGQTLPLIEGLGWEGKFIHELCDPGQVVGSQFLQW